MDSPAHIVHQRRRICAFLLHSAKEQQLDLAILSQKTGMKESTISRIFSGDFPPQFDHLLILADAIGVNITANR